MITIVIRPWVPAWYRFRKSAQIKRPGIDYPLPPRSDDTTKR